MDSSSLTIELYKPLTLFIVFEFEKNIKSILHKNISDSNSPLLNGTQLVNTASSGGSSPYVLYVFKKFSTENSLLKRISGLVCIT